MFSRALLLAALVVPAQATSGWKCYTKFDCRTSSEVATANSYYECFQMDNVLGAQWGGIGDCIMNKYDCWSDCDCSRYDYCGDDSDNTVDCDDASNTNYGDLWYNPALTLGADMGQWKDGSWITGYEACFRNKGAKSASIWGKSFYQEYDYQNQFVAQPVYVHPYGPINYVCDVDRNAWCPGTSTVDGDPHFKSISNNWFDFHGECDLVFLESKLLNMAIHVRTKIQHKLYSYVEAAALSINGDVLEVSEYGSVILNGVYLRGDDEALPKTVGGYPFELVTSDKKTHSYRVVLGEDKYIQMKSFKNLVGVTINIPRNELNDAVGMLGSVEMGGEFLGRDGKTVFYNANDFGNDWVVQPGSDANLFQGAAPHPGQCRMPDPATQQTRRLGEAMAREEAEEACAKWTMNKEACIADVMATGDKEMAANHY